MSPRPAHTPPGSGTGGCDGDHTHQGRASCFSAPTPPGIPSGPSPPGASRPERRCSPRPLHPGKLAHRPGPLSLQRPPPSRWAGPAHVDLPRLCGDPCWLQGALQPTCMRAAHLPLGGGPVSCATSEMTTHSAHVLAHGPCGSQIRALLTTSLLRVPD